MPLPSLTLYFFGLRLLHKTETGQGTRIERFASGGLIGPLLFL